MKQITHSRLRGNNNIPAKTLSRRLSAPVIGVSLAALLSLLAAGCGAAASGGGAVSYVCENGTPIDGNAPGPNSVGCQTCEGGFILDGGGDPGAGVSCVTIPYVCTNGIPAPGDAPVVNSTGCQACNDGYALNGPVGPGTACGVSFACENGNPASGVTLIEGAISCDSCLSGYQLVGEPSRLDTTCQPSHVCENGIRNPDTANAFGDVSCQSCTAGFALVGTAGVLGTTCMTDTDNDNVANVEDIDDDNDGLIEINSLVELNNVRHNLVGTSYDDEEADTGTGDTGDTTGAPTAATANCPTATNGVYLCGYELAGDFNFDLDFDGGTFDTAIAVGSPGVLDADDAAPYFAVDANNRGGWVPIGPGTGADDDAILANSFNAIFEGNNNTIFNLASIRPLEYMGLFGRVGPNGHIRNLGLVNAGVSTYATAVNSDLFQGGVLAGRVTGGTVTGCYATGNVFAGGRLSSLEDGFTIFDETEAQGGLIGILEEAVVVASHADVDVIGDDGEREALGGLIGIAMESTIIASYADGNVDASTANADSVAHYGGGLVAVTLESSRIIASHATGSVTVVPPTINNSHYYFYGGLVGRLWATPISASYSTGDITAVGGRENITNYSVGGFVGIHVSTSSIISASYASGNVTANQSADVQTGVSKLIGSYGTNVNNTLVRASYGFGTITAASERIINPVPAGVSTANGLTADNVPSCSSPVYTTQSACESPNLARTPGVWSTADNTCSPPDSDATDGVDYTAFASQNACTGTAKRRAHVWTTWDLANDYTLDAWVFAGGAAPKLRYADYDGVSGTVVDCDMFPAIIPGTATPLVCGANGSEIGGQ